MEPKIIIISPSPPGILEFGMDSRVFSPFGFVRCILRGIRPRIDRGFLVRPRKANHARPVKPWAS